MGLILLGVFLLSDAGSDAGSDAPDMLNKLIHFMYPQMLSLRDRSPHFTTFSLSINWLFFPRRVNSLNHCLSVLNKFVDLYQDLPASFEIFTPVKEHLQRYVCLVARSNLLLKYGCLYRIRSILLGSEKINFPLTLMKWSKSCNSNRYGIFQKRMLYTSYRSFC